MNGNPQPIGKPARIWMGTIPVNDSYSDFNGLSSRFDREKFAYAKGQRERGDTGYEHWQFILHCKKPIRLSGLRKIFGAYHFEPTRSSASENYVWKSDTAIPDTRFEWGSKPMRRNSDLDWESIRDQARSGRLDAIPADVYVRCYNQLRRISSDHMVPIGIERKVFVFWGATGTGKSRRAWEEASLQAYPKDPRSKFWDGYRDQEHVVLDEFRGGIDVSHLLRWLDRYPVIVEIKGSSIPLVAKKIWITSNLDPREWYPELDEETKKALLRRLEITYFPAMLFN
jgi:hypothetical protein